MIDTLTAKLFSLTAVAICNRRSRTTARYSVGVAMSSNFNWFVRNPVFGCRKPVNDTLPCRAFSQKSRTEAASLFENPHGLIAIYY